MPGRCAPSFTPMPLTSLTAASPTHKGRRMHGDTPDGRKRIIRLERVGSPLIPSRAARFITSLPEQPAAHGEKGTAYSQTQAFKRKLVASLCCTTPFIRCLLRQRLHFPSASRQLHFTRTDTSHAHLDYTPTPDPDVRCDNALTPLRQSANHFTRSELPTA